MQVDLDGHDGMQLATPARRLAGFLAESFILLFPWIIMAGDGGVGLLLLLAVWGWELWCWASSRTIGKHLLGMTVVSSRSGTGVGWGMMFVREIIGKSISGFIFALGYLWILIDSQHQGWHDKLIGAVVEESPEDAGQLQEY